MILLKEILEQPVTGKSLTTKVFRGDDTEFDTFDPKFIGKSTMSNTEGFWFSNSADAAEFYGHHVRPFEVTMKNPMVFSKEDFVKAYPHGPSHFAKLAKQRGCDGVVILNIIDGDRRSDVYCVWDPKQIRSLTPT